MKPEHRTILFVEDEPLLGELMTEALTDKGFDVEVAPDAGHALRYLLSGAEVDVLFTDIDLGEGMDGATLARLAREMRPQLPVVYASGRRSVGAARHRPGLGVPAQAVFAQPGRRDDRELGASVTRVELDASVTANSESANSE